MVVDSLEWHRLTAGQEPGPLGGDGHRRTPLHDVRDDPRVSGWSNWPPTAKEAATRRRLAAWCLASRGAGTFAELFGTRAPAMAGLCSRPNTTMCGRCLAGRWIKARPRSAQRLVTAACRFWYVRGPLSEGRTWAERALAMSGATPDTVRAGAITATAYLAWAQGDLQHAADLVAEGLALFRTVGDAMWVAPVLYTSALVAGGSGRASTRRGALHEEALALFRAGDKQLWSSPSRSTDSGAGLPPRQGSRPRATPTLTTPSSSSATSDTPYGAGFALTNLGEVARDRGDYARSDHAVRGEPFPATGRAATAWASRAVCGARHRRLTVRPGPSEAARLFGAAEALREAIGASGPAAS